jgi:hypothetical protein
MSGNTDEDGNCYLCGASEEAIELEDDEVIIKSADLDFLFILIDDEPIVFEDKDEAKRYKELKRRYRPE